MKTETLTLTYILVYSSVERERSVPPMSSPMVCVKCGITFTMDRVACMQCDAIEGIGVGGAKKEDGNPEVKLRHAESLLRKLGALLDRTCEERDAARNKMVELELERNEAIKAFEAAGVRFTQNDQIATGIEELSRDYEKLLTMWSQICDLFWPDRQQDARLTIHEVRDQIKDLKNMIRYEHDQYLNLIHSLTNLLDHIFAMRGLRNPRAITNSVRDELERELRIKITPRQTVVGMIHTRMISMQQTVLPDCMCLKNSPTMCEAHVRLYEKTAEQIAADIEKSADRDLTHACEAWVLKPGAHKEPGECLTYYDGCHCTMETLRAALERNNKLDKELKELKEKEVPKFYFYTYYTSYDYGNE